MIIGETIEITHANGEVETLDNVLVDPQEQNDIPSSTSSEDKVAYILHFPIAYTGDLVKARITVRNERFRVIGHPKPYTAENNLTEWNMPVKVARLGYSTTIKIQTSIQTQNSKGDSVTEWTDLLTTQARIADGDQTESQIAGRTQSEQHIAVYLDWVDALTGLSNTTARLIAGGDTFDITSIKNVGWQDDICIIEAVRRG